MMRPTINLLRRAAATSAADVASPSPLAGSPNPRHLHEHTAVKGVNPVAAQMIGYALSHARSDKSDESYALGLLVLEQCLISQTGDGNARAALLLTMSTLLHERWGCLFELADSTFGDILTRPLTGYREVECIVDSTIDASVAAMEALVGLYLQLGQDDTSSVVADKCTDLVKREASDESDSDYLVASARSNAAEGLVELVQGNLDSAGSYFQGNEGEKYSTGSAALLNGNVALSYGEYLHSTSNFFLAKEVHSKVVRGTSENNGSSESTLAACNMASEEVMLAENCALGQLYSHLGNYSDAEETLTKALTETEAYYGSNHPKVGIVLMCIALMYRWKAMKGHSSSLPVQEGLLCKAIELLKVPVMDNRGAEGSSNRRCIVALQGELMRKFLAFNKTGRMKGKR